jgi:HD-GYP domain-containing protein (c-di-GMP phosphodiesterase class II)
MKVQKEIWYFRGSRAAKLARALKSRWPLREVTAARAGRSGLPRFAAADGARVVCLLDLKRDDVARLTRLAARHPAVRLIGLGSGQDAAAAEPRSSASGNRRRASALYAVLPRQSRPAQVQRTISAAFENMEMAGRERGAREELARAEREMEALNRIGVALSAERDITRLLSLILSKMREITAADAGSLYLVEKVSDHEQRLRFKLTQNDSGQFPFAEYTLPITETSMAGHVALNGEVLSIPDAYHIAPSRPYHFNPKYDQDSGYRTRSILTLPMKNTKGEVIGVLQLINCKHRDPAALLHTVKDVERVVTPFSMHAARLALSLASQAAVAYENSKLYQDIETLFEGFVKAAVTAIEQRDPTTSGHSFRVSTLTVGLAETVDRCDAGSYAGTRFTREQMKEIRYAALLHDFGKVGVREEVLVKAKKLYPWQLTLLKQRFDYIRKEMEARHSQQKLQYVLERSRDEALSLIGPLEEEYAHRLAEVDDYYQTVLEANEPTVLAGGKFDKLIEIARQTFADSHGIERNYLEPDEIRFLSIPKGSLDPAERVQIESHVIHTFNFLTQIPWTKEISEIPGIARGHHEKLDGSGYPYQLKAEEIPVQTRMMTICDIFDALSASDRPYKRAVPADRALDILDSEARRQQLDQELFKLFIDARIYELTTKHQS